MEINKTNNQLVTSHGTLSGRTPLEEGRVSQLVAALHANTHTYGKPWSPAVPQGWLLALGDAADVSEAEFRAAMRWFLGNRKDFPAPSEVFDHCRSTRTELEDQRRREVERQEIAEYRAREEAREETRIKARWREEFGTETPTEEQLAASRERRRTENEKRFEAAAAKRAIPAEMRERFVYREVESTPAEEAERAARIKALRGSRN